MKDESKSKDIIKAIKILKGGGVVIFPTDTVYGIGARFDDSKAVKRIYKIKGTPKSRQFPVLAASIDQVKTLGIVTNQAQKLIDKYWPGGLTIILKTKDNRKIGFRMPNSRILESIINNAGPIIGTSANFHGQKTPTSYKELDPDFIKLADFALKGECDLKMASTVVDATVNPPKIIRQGALRLTPFDKTQGKQGKQ